MIYTYRCKCGEIFEITMKVIEIDKIKKVSCPKCKSVRTRKIITTAPQIKFVGKGFYSTDNKKP